MKAIAVYNNTGHFKMIPDPPKKGKFCLSLWVVQDGLIQRDNIATPPKTRLTDLIGGVEDLVDNFLNELGIEDGDLVEGLGWEIHKWR